MLQSKMNRQQLFQTKLFSAFRKFLIGKYSSIVLSDDLLQKQRITLSYDLFPKVTCTELLVIFNRNSFGEIIELTSLQLRNYLNESQKRLLFKSKNPTTQLCLI